MYDHGNELDPGNYTPTSLPSNIHRIFEKKMAYKGVKIFLIKHNFFCPSHYGFCKHFSTKPVLLDIVGKI